MGLLVLMKAATACMRRLWQAARTPHVGLGLFSAQLGQQLPLPAHGRP